MVEAGGVEPPSEKVFKEASPSADRNLSFACFTSTDGLETCYRDRLSTNLRELVNERPGLFDARPDLPG
jgi:hypothetical protein